MSRATIIWGVIGRPAPAIGSSAGVERRQVQGLHDRDDEPGEVVLGQPLIQAGRHQEGLVPVTANEGVGHGSSENANYVDAILSDRPLPGQLIRGFRDTLSETVFNRR